MALAALVTRWWNGHTGIRAMSGRPLGKKWSAGLDAEKMSQRNPAKYQQVIQSCF